MNNKTLRIQDKREITLGSKAGELLDDIRSDVEADAKQAINDIGADRQAPATSYELPSTAPTQNPDPKPQTPDPGAQRRYLIAVRAIVEVFIPVTAPASAPDLEDWTSAPVNSDDIIDAIQAGDWDIAGPADGTDLYKVENAEPIRSCRVCGCTEHEPCLTSEGACGWVAGEEDLCTACFDSWADEKYFTAEAGIRIYSSSASSALKPAATLDPKPQTPDPDEGSEP